MEVTVASHNTMHGVFLEALLARYRQLTQREQVEVLCLQENRRLEPGRLPPPQDDDCETHAELLAQALGFQCVCQAPHPQLAVLVHPEWRIARAFLVELPRLARLSWFERLYIRGGKTKQKCALVVTIERQAESLTIANFHLETAGDNQHRQRQVAAVADALATQGLTEHLVVCGDTNAFTWSKADAGRLLRELLAPITRVSGAELKSPIEATHFFARQHEDLLTHRLVTLLGRLGVDHPLPYDVICSNLEAIHSQSVTTEESDHDLVFSRLRWPSARRA